MKRRLFSWINTKMFFKQVGFKNRGLVCQSEVAAAFCLAGSRRRLRDQAARKGCPKACDTPQDTYATSARWRASIGGLLLLPLS